MRLCLSATRLACASACLAVYPGLTAGAHVVAGARVFPVTLTFDDPGVSDEVSIPALGYSRDGVDDGVGPSHTVDLGFEFDKTITPTTALILNDGYDIQQVNGARTRTGFDNLVVTGKWQILTSDLHELVVSLGVSREIGGTGTTHMGADRTGSTTPTAYLGKGLGDLPVPALRPFAVTGELGYTIADTGLKQIQPAGDGIAGQFNLGQSNAWAGGISLQYSIPYLQSQVHDLGLHGSGLKGLLGRMIPVVEFTWSSPATRPSQESESWIAAPGVLCLANWGEVGVEALLPLDRAAGSTVGAVALVHLFLDDLFPAGIGRPVFR